MRADQFETMMWYMPDEEWEEVVKQLYENGRGAQKEREEKERDSAAPLPAAPQR